MLEDLRLLAGDWISNRISKAMFFGIVGSLIHDVNSPQLYGDLVHMVKPGLSAMGVELTLEHAGIVSQLSDFCLMSDVRSLAIVLKSQPDITPSESSIQELPQTLRRVPWQDTNPTVLMHQLPITIPNGPLERPQLTSATSVNDRLLPPGSFLVWLKLRSGANSQPTREAVPPALLRWCAFADAYPERTVAIGIVEPEVYTNAVEFLHESIGRQSSPFATRVRRAAAAFDVADAGMALFHLKDAVLTYMRAPASLKEALLSDPNYTSSAIDRRELIYAARSGTDSIRTMAARRLTLDVEDADVSCTLQQLRYDSSPLVRAVVSSVPVS